MGYAFPLAVSLLPLWAVRGSEKLWQSLYHILGLESDRQQTSLGGMLGHWDIYFRDLQDLFPELHFPELAQKLMWAWIEITFYLICITLKLCIFWTVETGILQTAEAYLWNSSSIHKKNSQECVQFHELLLLNKFVFMSEMLKEFISIKVTHR